MTLLMLIAVAMRMALLLLLFLLSLLMGLRMLFINLKIFFFLMFAHLNTCSARYIDLQYQALNCRLSIV